MVMRSVPDPLDPSLYGLPSRADVRIAGPTGRRSEALQDDVAVPFACPKLGTGDFRRYRPGHHLGVIVLRLEHESAASARRAIEGLASTRDLEPLAGCTVAFRRGLLRIRRA